MQKTTLACMHMINQCMHIHHCPNETRDFMFASAHNPIIVKIKTVLTAREAIKHASLNIQYLPSTVTLQSKTIIALTCTFRENHLYTLVLYVYMKFI